MIQLTSRKKKMALSSALIMVLSALIYGTFDYLSNNSSASTEEKAEKFSFPAITTTNKNSIANSNITSNSNVTANSTVTTITTGNGNISVNSNSSANVTNSNNQTKIDNTKNTNIQNQYFQSDLNDSGKDKKTARPDKKLSSQSQAPTMPPTIEQKNEIPTRPFSINNDPEYKTYLNSIIALHDEGADLSDCKNVQACVRSYNIWHREVTQLLSEVEIFIQQKYRKRTYLTRRFDRLNINPPAIAEQDQVSYCRTLFFSQVELFGGINSYVEEAFIKV